eukprot:1493757-Alexandrium_andersonii.AAC.1
MPKADPLSTRYSAAASMAAASADRGPFSLQRASQPRRTAADGRSMSMYSLTCRRTSVRSLLAH